METRFEISAGDYRLVAAPTRGGAILALDWQGRPLLRPTTGSGILDVACFPLVPFSNRIALGRFRWNGRSVALAPNFPAVDAKNPLHGFGWLREWSVAEAQRDSLRLVHDYRDGDWPWAYRAQIDYVLADQGLIARLAVVNQSDEVMPAGLGFHPYLPRTESTRYLGLHRGEWRGDAAGLPLDLDEKADAIDWWQGLPVGTRPVDRVYTGREGSLQAIWPERGLSLGISCSDNLTFTSVFVPQNADWFCIEPVSHPTDAINRPDTPSAMAGLRPGETLAVEIRLRASAYP